MAIHKIAQNHVGTERVRTDQVGPDRVNSVEQLSVPKLIALHLIPGALVTATFVVLAPLVKAAGLPPIAALLAAILLVLVPVELGIVLRSVRRDGGAAAVPYRQRLGPREWFWLVPVLIVPAFVGFGVHRLIEPWLIALFGWLPVWFAFPVPLGSPPGCISTHRRANSAGPIRRDDQRSGAAYVGGWNEARLLGRRIDEHTAPLTRRSS